MLLNVTENLHFSWTGAAAETFLVECKEYQCLRVKNGPHKQYNSVYYSLHSTPVKLEREVVHISP